MQGIGIGTSDFKKLRVKDYYFIDNNQTKKVWKNIKYEYVKILL